MYNRVKQQEEQIDAIVQTLVYLNFTLNIFSQECIFIGELTWQSSKFTNKFKKESLKFF